MLEEYFAPYRKQIIGIGQEFETNYGLKKIIYADWTASGRQYQPIEDILNKEIAPFVGNTHTETTVTGCTMTTAYHLAKSIIKKHVNARKSDILISSNSGMTGVANKFQRILGLRLHEKYLASNAPQGNDKPVIFITHMEHHSNQTSWLETTADVEIIKACGKGLVDLNHLDLLLEKYKERTFKAAAVTSCSNVTGIKTPYFKIAKKMHKAGGYCFVDFACSAPYIGINMHPPDPECQLDAIYFSPHKFLGGPGSSGVLIFNPKLYTNKIPDNPGGGTVDWTNPWGEHKYFDEIEAREDGGTPAFLQTIKVALCIQLKDKMGVENILLREKHINEIVFEKLEAIKNLHILADIHKERLSVFSFYIDDLHYNLAVKLLNDKYGIQVRGGCSCAGTYGHYLLEVSQEKSDSITQLISSGDNSYKPGWVRMSLHPTTTDQEVQFILGAIKALAENHELWSEDYKYYPKKNEYKPLRNHFPDAKIVEPWFQHQLI